ncbi:Kinase superfamily protein isoform 1 [Hibiscus syriacus]|uniref:Kinase superfamily protein isoform 1 n=1 Tax=Hibiscus syriacus TaxID=106335 RepID=A0A6A2YH01_HIBSY|nr:Kinase superfamily protein isoform 1 [Hibiscus syriacus]
MLRKFSHTRSRKQLSQLFSTISQISSQQSKPRCRSAWTALIGGAPRALRRLYDGFGALKVPFVFLTNGGGVRESKRAAELSELLGVKISPLQVLQGHSPFKQLVNRNVISIDEYALCFDNIDPLAPHKKWGTMEIAVNRTRKCSISSEFGQHLSSVILLIGAGTFRQGAFPSERFGMGAFRIALESLFNSIHTEALKYTYFGKPNPVAFKNAEVVLTQLASFLYCENHGNSGSHDFQTLYMIGDNPEVDIKGARKAGNPWFPILTRTGVFKGDHDSNHPEFPANLVVDTVDFIMRNRHQIID